jgi:hypothetical protein
LNVAADRRTSPHGTLKGGRRASDPPLTTRDCADWIGTGTDYVVGAINAGELKAERFARPGKRAQYRIHLDDFIAFLKSIGFQRIPRMGSRQWPSTNG